jgi:glycosyltransferase involved in cell wall biosynthesis
MSEGFGLPVLEAFAAGAAVVTGNRTSLPEVAGEAAELVDPESIDDIRRGLEVLMSDPHRREELVQIGRLRARDFTWRGCAERFIALLEQIHSG